MVELQYFHKGIDPGVTYDRDEIEAAFAEFRRRGVETHDWPAWAKLFTGRAVIVPSAHAVAAARSDTITPAATPLRTAGIMTRPDRRGCAS